MVRVLCGRVNVFHPVVVTVWLLLWAIRVFGAPLLSVYIAALALKPVVVK